MGQFGGLEQFANRYLPGMLGMSQAEAMFARFGESRNLIRQQQDYQQQIGRPGTSPSGGAAALDTQRLQQFAINVQEAIHGRRLNREETLQAQSMGATAGQYLPMMRQMLAGAGVPPALIQSFTAEAIFGSRGSAVDFNARSNSAFANMVDVSSNQRGFDGSFRARMGENIFRELTQSGGLQNQVRGFNAAELGDVLAGMSARGQLGMSQRGLSIATQGRQLRNFGEQDFRAAAMQTAAGAAFIDSAGRVTDQEGFDKVLSDVKTTYSQLQNASGTISKTALAGMTGGEELLDMSEAKRMAQKIGEVTQSLKAMDELFQENGQTASLPQLMRAVESLTEGASNFMSASETTNFLRNAQQVARVGNMSLDTFNSLRSLGAQTARNYGASGIVGSTAAIDAIAQINGNNDAFSVRAFGRMDKEQTQQATIASRAAGAASFSGKVFGLVQRLGDELNAPAGSEAAQFIEAVRNGDASAFTSRSEQQVMSLLTQAGVPRSRIEAVLNDKRGLEAASMASPEAFANFVASSQRTEVVSRLANRGASAMGDVLRDAAGNTIVGLNEEEKSRLMFRMSKAAAEAAVNMSTADASDPAVARQRLVDAALAADGVTPAMRQAILQDTTLGDSLYSALNAASDKLNGTTIEDMRTIHGKEAQDRAVIEKRRNAVDAAAAEAASGIGASTIYEKFGDLMTREGGLAGMGVQEFARNLLGGDNAAALAIADPAGELAAAFGYQQDMKALDPINNEQDFNKWKAYSAVTAGLNKGGSFASDAIAAASKAGITLPQATLDRLQKAAEDPSQAGNALLEAAGIDEKMLGLTLNAKGLYDDKTRGSAIDSARAALQAGGTLTPEQIATLSENTSVAQAALRQLDATPELLDKLGPDQREAVRNTLRQRKDLAALEKKYGLPFAEILKTKQASLSEAERNTLSEVQNSFLGLHQQMAYPEGVDGRDPVANQKEIDAIRKDFDETREYTKPPGMPLTSNDAAKPATPVDGAAVASTASTVTGNLTLLIDGTVDAKMMMERLKTA